MSEFTPKIFSIVILRDMSVHFAMKHIYTFLFLLYESGMVGKYLITFEENNLFRTGS
jgi:hypothetical protein